MAPGGRAGVRNGARRARRRRQRAGAAARDRPLGRSRLRPPPRGRARRGAGRCRARPRPVAPAGPASPRRRRSSSSTPPPALASPTSRASSVTREAGDLVFQPQTAPGDYYVYYLPFLMTGRSNYPTIDYPKPVDWADTEWLARQRPHARGARRRRVAAPARGARRRDPVERRLRRLHAHGGDRHRGGDAGPPGEAPRRGLPALPRGPLAPHPHDRRPAEALGRPRGRRAARGRGPARRVREPAGRASSPWTGTSRA